MKVARKEADAGQRGSFVSSRNFEEEMAISKLYLDSHRAIVLSSFQ